MTPNTLRSCPSEQRLTDYLNDRLDASRRFQLEEHLLDCPLCADAVAELRENGLPATGDLNKLEARILAATVGSTKPLTSNTEEPAHENAMPETESVSNGTSYPWRPVLAVAASVVLLLGLWWWYRWQTYEQRLYAEYFEPLPRYGYVSVRSAGIDPDLDMLVTALKAQTDEDYELSATTWSAILESETDDLDFRPHLYLALAQMELGRLEEAVDNLAQLPTGFESEIGEEAEWYRALLDLRLERSESAANRLRALSQTGKTVYAAQASALLARL